ncbi:hypothetical protein CPB83DRAFT_838007 [Crepidotus variabilis]|uniref:Uncharacterized protein n=1 Tax=Crepidotus variabilis TaxID=179855 RepID=A0A9P6EAS3_9AGAR|nr:hypothetical protein CPB83DRAFT_838007 [Crepidotus variabilis]
MFSKFGDRHSSPLYCTETGLVLNALSRMHQLYELRMKFSPNAYSADNLDSALDALNHNFSTERKTRVYQIVSLELVKASGLSQHEFLRLTVETSTACVNNDSDEGNIILILDRTFNLGSALKDDFLRVVALRLRPFIYWVYSLVQGLEGTLLASWMTNYETVWDRIFLAPKEYSSDSNCKVLYRLDKPFMKLLASAQDSDEDKITPEIQNTSRPLTLYDVLLMAQILGTSYPKHQIRWSNGLLFATHILSALQRLCVKPKDVEPPEVWAASWTWFGKRSGRLDPDIVNHIVDIFLAEFDF